MRKIEIIKNNEKVKSVGINIEDEICTIIIDLSKEFFKSFNDGGTKDIKYKIDKNGLCY